MWHCYVMVDKTTKEVKGCMRTDEPGYIKPIDTVDFEYLVTDENTYEKVFPCPILHKWDDAKADLKPNDEAPANVVIPQSLKLRDDMQLPIHVKITRS